MSKIRMEKIVVLCVADMFLNLFCASQHAGCTMHGQGESPEKYTSVKTGNYTLLWEIPCGNVRAKEDVYLHFRLENSVGKDIAEDGSGKIYVTHFLTGNTGDTPDGPLWVGQWNPAARRYEVAGSFPEPGNWGLWVEFYVQDSLYATSRLLLKVTGDAGHSGHEAHNHDGMQNHGGGCH